jgi:GWxTD domain-containing protein
MKLFGLLLTCLLLSSSTFAQKKQLRAYVDNKQFFAPGVGNYVEFNFQFVGYSIEYNGLNGGLIGELVVETSVQQGEETIASNAYRLSTPFMRDSIIEDFYDVQRYQLKPGNYNFNIKLTDLNSEALPLTASMPIHVEEMGDAISISDIEVAEVATEGDPESLFYKSGYNIIPRLSTFYPEQLNMLPIYFEVYNSMDLQDSTFSIKQSIFNADEGVELEDQMVITKHTAGDVVPVFRKIPLEKLTTGKYVLRFTIVTENDLELSSQSYEFERSNDKIFDYSGHDIVLDPAFQESISADSIGYYLESLIPISNAEEVRTIIEIAKKKDAEEARKHIQMHWVAIAGKNGAYEEWMKYKAQVQLVERIYANNFQEGFETDRGRVYLQYGSPTNIITREVSSTEYPYEIWQYNKIGVFSNKRFIFYNPDLVNNAYRLLHSDMVGELKNHSWPHELSKRNTKSGGVDNPNANVIDKWGQNSQNDFRQY